MAFINKKSGQITRKKNKNLGTQDPFIPKPQGDRKVQIDGQVFDKSEIGRGGKTTSPDIISAKQNEAERFKNLGNIKQEIGTDFLTPRMVEEFNLIDKSSIEAKAQLQNPSLPKVEEEEEETPTKVEGSPNVVGDLLQAGAEKPLLSEEEETSRVLQAGVATAGLALGASAVLGLGSQLATTTTASKGVFSALKGNAAKIIAGGSIFGALTGYTSFATKDLKGAISGYVTASKITLTQYQTGQITLSQAQAQMQNYTQEINSAYASIKAINKFNPKTWATGGRDVEIDTLNALGEIYLTQVELINEQRKQQISNIA